MPGPSQDPAGTPYQLAGLVVAIRRHILDAPSETWDRSVVRAAQQVTAAVGDRIADVTQLDPTRRSLPPK